MSSTVTKPKLVLHICCSICGAYLSELLKDRFEIIYYYYNPNIHPEEEYEKRKASVQKLAALYNSEFIEGDYAVQEWYKTISGFEGEPEGGKRCPLCFRMRLAKTAQLAVAKGATHFTTTLATSPYKNEDVIGAIGTEIAKELGLSFEEAEKVKRTQGFVRTQDNEKLFKSAKLRCIKNVPFLGSVKVYHKKSIKSIWKN